MSPVAMRGRRSEGQPKGTKEAKVAKGTRATQRPPGHRSLRFLVLLVVGLLLCLLGVVMVLSASSVNDLRAHGDAWYHLKRQVIWLLIGLAGLMVMIRIDYRRLRPLAVPGLFGCMALLMLVLVPGVGLSAIGSTRWLDLGVVSLQPSELAKMALVLYCADLLSRRERPLTDKKLTLYPVVGMVGLIGVLLMLEPDLGTTMIMGAIAVAMLFFAGLQLRLLALLVGGGALGAFGLTMSAGYRRQRLLGMLDPWTDPLNTGWQAIQSGVAISNGGLFGVGLGASRSKWGFLPFAHTDFIYAIIAEEFGLIGAGLVLVGFLVIGLVGLSTALHAPDPFGQLLAAGITTWIMIQAFVNIGAVLGRLPITGVPLPFVSFGGTALIVTLGAFGILLNIARQTP